MYSKLLRHSGHVIAFIAIPCLFLSSCASKYVFQNSYIVPAAEGRVKVKKDNNSNYKIDLKVKNLAEPKNLTPSRQCYVVWMDVYEGSPRNIGQLKTSSGLFGGSLKSSLSTVTPYKPQGFFITAEDLPTIQYPGREIILRTSTTR